MTPWPDSTLQLHQLRLVDVVISELSQQQILDLELLRLLKIMMVIFYIMS